MQWFRVRRATASTDGWVTLTETLKLFLGGIEIPCGHLRGLLNCNVLPG